MASKDERRERVSLTHCWASTRPQDAAYQNTKDTARKPDFLISKASGLSARALISSVHAQHYGNPNSRTQYCTSASCRTLIFHFHFSFPSFVRPIKNTSKHNIFTLSRKLTYYIHYRHTQETKGTNKHDKKEHKKKGTAISLKNKY
jgi:hypothetical protein